jgi:hypothetical protein
LTLYISKYVYFLNVALNEKKGKISKIDIYCKLQPPLMI